MSCDVAMAAYLFLASTGPGGPPPTTVATLEAPQSVASEPLFVDIVKRAGRLRGEVEHYRTPGLKSLAAFKPLPDFGKFQSDITELSALDMQGHVELAKSGQDGDLKCILKGISQDLPLKMKALLGAQSGSAEDAALEDMFYLLRDNVEVITTPPKAGSVSG
ncbi:MAG TPA: hypothetical protein VHX64_02285 [Caulobacteraceae bacterium]|nr:hypothetical protein [Caulobacteraceae bacterium]